MEDKKFIASIIKNLERTIGILENCGETGEMSLATRKRIIEMLNTSTMDVYFYKVDKKGNEVLDMPSLTKNPTLNIPVEEFVEQEHEVALAPNVHEEENVSSLHEVVEELNEIQSASETPLPDPIQEKETEKIIKEEVVQEDEFLAEIDVQYEKTVIESDEFKSTEKDNVINNAEKESPFFELEQEPITQYNQEIEEEESEIEEGETLEEEKQKLDEIRRNLEQERLRLEAELQSWNLERQKREEEMRAAEQLLIALAEEREKRQKQVETHKVDKTEKKIEKTEKIERAFNIPDYNIEKQTFETASNKQKKQEKKTEDNLINNFLGNNKKFLHETFEVDEINVQGMSPVSDLSRVIGINDKFQFIKELFGGDSDLFAETISKLNTIGSYDSGVSYLFSNFQWDKNNGAVKRILTLLKRRYM